MSPNKRAKKTVAELPGPVADKTVVPGSIDKTGRNNKYGLPALPVELSLEIVSYFPMVGYTGAVIPHYPASPAVMAYLDRPKVLRALSQTCRSLRSIFLPILWERLEVWADSTGDAWYMHAGKSLQRMSDGLAQDTELASYVRIVSVVLTRYSTATVLPAFRRCLSALPNLHTIHANRVHCKMTTALKIAFEGLRLPSVRTAILPSYAHELLRCCPGVRRVVCTSGDGSQLVTAMAKVCKNVEVLEQFWPDENIMKRIVKAVPNLRVIRLLLAGPDALQLLSPLKKIATIELTSLQDKREMEEKQLDHSPAFKSSMDAAKDVLRKQSSVGGKKLLKIRYGIYRADAIDVIEVE